MRIILTLVIRVSTECLLLNAQLFSKWFISHARTAAASRSVHAHAHADAARGVGRHHRRLLGATITDRRHVDARTHAAMWLQKGVAHTHARLHASTNQVCRVAHGCSMSSGSTSGMVRLPYFAALIGLKIEDRDDETFSRQRRRRLRS